MGKAQGCDFSLKEGDNKRYEAIHCDKFRGLLVEKSNFQTGWNSRNKKSLELLNIVPT